MAGQTITFNYPGNGTYGSCTGSIDFAKATPTCNSRDHRNDDHGHGSLGFRYPDRRTVTVTLTGYDGTKTLTLSAGQASTLRRRLAGQTITYSYGGNDTVGRTDTHR